MVGGVDGLGWGLEGNEARVVLTVVWVSRIKARHSQGRVIGCVWPWDLKSQVEEIGRHGMSDIGDRLALG